MASAVEAKELKNDCIHCVGVLKNLFCIICQQDVAESRIPIMLCGNKSDLRSKYESKGQKPVSFKEGEAMAKEHEVSENLNYA